MRNALALPFPVVDPARTRSCALPFRLVARALPCALAFALACEPFGARELEGRPCDDGGNCPAPLSCVADVCVAGAGEGEGEGGEGEGEGGEGEGEAGEGEGEAGEGEGEAGEGEGEFVFGIEALDGVALPAAGPALTLSGVNSLELNASPHRIVDGGGADVATLTSVLVGEIVVVRAASLTIEQGASLLVTGDTALAFVIDGDVQIDGTLDVSAPGTGTQGGPGGADGGGVGTEGFGGGAGGGGVGAGGGGGGHGGGGGNGGLPSGDATDNGGGPAGPQDLHLLGGGAGGGGGDVVGGGGGGALYIGALGDLSLGSAARIFAEGGGGGGAATGSSNSAGGGGSGGAVFLEAHSLSFAGSAEISVRGGAGGLADSDTFADVGGSDDVRGADTVGARTGGNGGAGRVRLHSALPLDVAAQADLAGHVAPGNGCASIVTFGRFFFDVALGVGAVYDETSVTTLPQPVRFDGVNGSDEGLGTSLAYADPSFGTVAGAPGSDSPTGDVGKIATERARIFQDETPTANDGLGISVAIGRDGGGTTYIAAGRVSGQAVHVLSFLSEGDVPDRHELDGAGQVGFGRHLAMSDDANVLVAAGLEATGGVQVFRRDGDPFFGAPDELSGDGTAAVTAVAADIDRIAFARGGVVTIRVYDDPLPGAWSPPANVAVGGAVTSLAILGETVLAGLAEDDRCGDDAGAVVVIAQQVAGWDVRGTVGAYAPAPGLRFGQSVHAELERMYASGVGAVFLAHLDREDPTAFSTVHVVEGDALEGFGARITGDAGHLAVASPQAGATGKGGFAGAFSVFVVP